MSLSETTIKKYDNMRRLFWNDLDIYSPNETFINLLYQKSERNQTYISNETIKLCLNSIIYYLRGEYDKKPSDKLSRIIQEYSNYINHMRKICLYKTQNINTNTDNVPEWKYFLNIHKNLKDQFKELENTYNIKLLDAEYNNKININIPKYKQILKKYLISSLYVTLPPRRLLDYSQMYIYINDSETDIEDIINNDNYDKNYFYYNDSNPYDVASYFIFKKYKTYNTYKTQVFPINEELKDLIILYAEYNNILNGCNLLFKNVTNTVEIQLNNILKTIFNTSVDIIRHSYISNIFNKKNIPSNNDIKKISTFMGHNIATHINYRRNTKTEDLIIPEQTFKTINQNIQYGEVTSESIENIYNKLYNKETKSDEININIYSNKNSLRYKEHKRIIIYDEEQILSEFLTLFIIYVLSIINKIKKKKKLIRNKD